MFLLGPALSFRTGNEPSVMSVEFFELFVNLRTEEGLGLVDSDTSERLVRCLKASDDALVYTFVIAVFRETAMCDNNATELQNLFVNLPPLIQEVQAEALSRKDIGIETEPQRNGTDNRGRNLLRVLQINQKGNEHHVQTQNYPDSGHRTSHDGIPAACAGVAAAGSGAGAGSAGN